jgi:hypothetical protein
MLFVMFARRGRAVRKWLDVQASAEPQFDINRQLCAFISPLAELSTWTGVLSDIDVRRRVI